MLTDVKDQLSTFAEPSFIESLKRPLEDRLSLWQFVGDNCADLLSIEDSNDEYVYASSSSLALFGWAPQELCNRSLYALLHADDARCVADERAHLADRDVRVRYRFRCRPGEFRWVESRSHLDVDRQHVVTVTRDIQEEVERLAALEELATHDSLTQLLNRRGLENALDAEFQRSCRHRQVFSLALFDIDGFKQVNDNCGHQAGDELLKSVSGCMEHHKRAYDVLGRWGGDEFMFLFPKTSLAYAEEIARRIHETVVKKLTNVSLSFGLSDTRNADSTIALLAQADAALYEAKYRGGNQVVSWPKIATERRSVTPRLRRQRVSTAERVQRLASMLLRAPVALSKSTFRDMQTNITTKQRS